MRKLKNLFKRDKMTFLMIAAIGAGVMYLYVSGFFKRSVESLKTP